MAGLTEEGRAVIVVFLDFGQTFSPVFSLTLNTHLHKSLPESEDLQVETEKRGDNSVNKAAISCLC